METQLKTTEALPALEQIECPECGVAALDGRCLTPECGQAATQSLPKGNKHGSVIAVPQPAAFTIRGGVD